MANWGKLTSQSGSLFFSNDSLTLLEQNYNAIKSKENETGYLDKYFGYTETMLLSNSVIPGYGYLFLTNNATTYDYSINEATVGNSNLDKTYYDINLYGANIINNSFNLTKLGGFGDITDYTNINNILTDQNGIYIVGDIDTDKKVTLYDIAATKYVDATNISNNLSAVLSNYSNLYFQSPIFKSTTHGDLALISGNDINGKYVKTLVSNINSSTGSQIIKTFDNSNINLSLAYASEESNGNVTFLTHDWGTWDNETKTATDTYYISTLDSTGSITDKLIASHKFYSTNPEDGYLGYSNYNYFLWMDDSGDKWLIQNSQKNLQLNPNFNNYTSQKNSDYLYSSNNYKAWFLDSFKSINDAADVTTSYFENNSIEDKYNGSTYLTDNPQNGELILGIVGAEANDISYFSSAFERVEVAINEANNFDPYRYLASNKHLMDVFGGNITQATSHYNQYAKNENNTIMKFDEWIYMASNLDLVPVFNGDAYGGLIHYVNFGYKEGRGTNTFDASNYLASNNDLIFAMGIDSSKAAQHFASIGFKEGRSLDTFDEWSYLASNDDLIPGLDKTLADNHFTQYGLWEGRSKDIFDEWSYLATNIDLINTFNKNISESVKHFVNYGFNEGRSKDTFDEWSYMASNTDLIVAFGGNTTTGVEHFVKAGFYEGRAKDNFDEWSYMASNTDLIVAFGGITTKGVEHFVQAGFYEGRAKDNFDEWGYLASNTDLIQTYGSNTFYGTAHYIGNGYIEGRITTGFNASNYLNKYSDLQTVFGTNTDLAKIHFVQSGYWEGRTDT